MRTYSTKQAAKRAGIHWVTLLRWVASEKIKASQSIDLGGQIHWRWTDRDVERIHSMARKPKA